MPADEVMRAAYAAGERLGRSVIDEVRSTPEPRLRVVGETLPPATVVGEQLSQWITSRVLERRMMRPDDHPDDIASFELGLQDGVLAGLQQLMAEVKARAIMTRAG